MAAGPRRTEVRQGAIFRLNAGATAGIEVEGWRPWVVLQNDLMNTSRIGTIIAAPMTRTLVRGEALGNVIIEAGEGGIRDRSVVNVSQVRAIDRRFFREHVGQLSGRRVREIIDGLNLLLTPRG
jgi:mRNA-degrading endonuclease toxin of MazEF toxin-antitoxin module